MKELNYIVKGRGFDICKDPGDVGEEWYTYYSGLITFTLHREDMIDFIRSVTDPENQERMKEELQELETRTCQRFMKEVETEIVDGLMKHVREVNGKGGQIGTN